MNMHCILLLFNDLLLIQSHASIQPSFRLSIHPSIHPSIHLHLHCSPLHCSPLHCFMLHCITLHCIALHYIALQYLVNFTTSYYITFHDIALHVIWHYPHTHRLCIYVRTHIYIYTYNNVEIEQLFPSAAGGWTLPGPDGGRLGESGACQGQLAQIEWHIEKIHNCSSTYRLRQRHCDLFKAMICAFWPVCCLTPWLKGLKHIYIYIRII